MSETVENKVPEATPQAPPAPPIPGVWQRRLRLLSHFFAGQMLVQMLNFLIGFLLLRWMSIEAYAQFSVAFAFQSTVGTLVDLGFSGCIIALVGERAGEPEVIGRYVRSARHFRLRSFFIVMTVASFVYPFVVIRQEWGWTVKLLLYVGIVGALLAQNLIMYGPPLLIARRLKQYYRAQIVAGVFRQLAHTAMFASGTLYSWAVSWVAAGGIAIYGWLYRREALPLIREPAQPDPATNRQMLRYLMPLMPGVVFAAFQAHIMVAIITVLGKTQNIAEVGALGRLAQVFTLLAAFNGAIVEPYIARVPRTLLPRRYTQVVLGQIAVGIAITLFAFAFPGVLLWLIGPKYYHLRPEVSLVATTAAVSYLCGGLWTMHSARKWVYGWGTALYIIVLLVTQVLAVLLMDLSSTRGVVRFGLLTSVAVLFVHICNGVYGFRNGPSRRLQETPEPV